MWPPEGTSLRMAIRKWPCFPFSLPRLPFFDTIFFTALLLYLASPSFFIATSGREKGKRGKSKNHQRPSDLDGTKPGKPSRTAPSVLWLKRAFCCCSPLAYATISTHSCFRPPMNKGIPPKTKGANEEDKLAVMERGKEIFFPLSLYLN